MWHLRIYATSDKICSIANIIISSQSSSLDLPIGTILPYTGNLGDIPAGWHLCDGTNGTPDLCDRFLTGVGNSYSLGDTGGENYHQLTTSEMPSHTHRLPTGYANLGSGWAHWVGESGAELSGVTNGSYPAYTSITGENMPHENRPPYYAVYYIMRVK